MSSSKERKDSSDCSQVAKFYDGKCLFVTGATGYLGIVLLEVLLRCCPNIGRIYILLRWKKGLQPEDRKKALFKKEIFSKVKEKNPDALKKVIVISGDTSCENLGMNEDDLLRIIDEVSIVFHCAASISFLKPLRFMVLHNVIATYNIMELCRKLKKLEAFVYTSTAYSAAGRTSVIDEKIYTLPFPVEEALKAFRKGNDDELEILFNKCVPKFPTYYTFTKCLAENLLAEQASDLPLSIVRPSLIICCWKGGLPGYVEGDSGMVGFGLGIGKGFIRVLPVDLEKRIDHIPADVVANTHILAAWRQATERLPSPYIYNCVSTEINPCTWNEYISALLKVLSKHPLPKSYRKPYVITCKNDVMYWFHAIINHYIPAVVIDSLLRITGRHPRFLSMYRFYDKAIKVTKYFMKTEMNFRSENFISLPQKINAVDEELFPVSLLGYEPDVIANLLPTGAPFYKWATDKMTSKERLRIIYMRYILTSLIQWTLIGALIFLLYITVF